MAITLMTAAKLLEIERSSAKTLPDNPSNAGMTAETVRRRLYQGLTALRDEVQRMAGEANVSMQTISENIVTVCDLDETETEIDWEIQNCTDKSYSSSSIVSVQITIPDDVFHGFYSAVNYKSGAAPTEVQFVNESSYDLKVFLFGSQKLDGYTPPANKTVVMMFHCDGINVYCNIMEVA